MADLQPPAGDADLYIRCTRGESTAWEEIHHRVLAVCRWARWRLGDRAEDIASAVLISLIEGGLDSVRDPAAFGAFLRRVTSNRILDEFRARREFATEDRTLERSIVKKGAGEPSQMRTVLDRETAAVVIESIQELGESCQKLLDAYLGYRVGLIESYRELESVLGRKANVISVQVRRCLERLRRDARIQEIGSGRGWAEGA